MSASHVKNIGRARNALETIDRFIARFADRTFIRNLSVFAAAEIANKATRILAMVIIARSLTVEAIGIAALAITSFELIRIITNNGIGQMIVRSDDASLESVCNRAHQLNFIFCGGAAALQVMVGVCLWQLTQTPVFLGMSICLALVFLGMPFGLVRIFRTMRRNKMDVVARINFQQVSSDNALSLILALLGFGAWALVLPKLLTFPIWLIGARCSDNWRPKPQVTPASYSDFRKFCAPILATETLKGVRLHADKAIIAGILGVEALGLYYFAFNAGLGLAQTVSMAFSACLYPQLCKIGRNYDHVVAVWTKITGVFLAGALFVFGMQIIAAPLYVPLVFGEAWRITVPIVTVLCLAAVPRFLSDCASQLARASRLTQLETGVTLISSIATMTAIAIGAQLSGLFGAAIGLVMAAWIVEPVGAFWVRRQAIKGRA